VFCQECGKEIDDGSKFCSGCGAIQNKTTQQTGVNNSTALSNMDKTPPDSQVEKEREYYRGEGELIVKRTEHRGAGRKAVSFIAGGGIGYLAFGRDKTRKSKAKGTIIITNKAIYCAGNDYPFDRILSITKGGRISKSIILTFEKEVAAGGRSEGSGFGGTGGMSIEIEIKTQDIEGMFKGLENAKMDGKF